MKDFFKIIEKINNGPAVLFLGQAYLSRLNRESRKDVFLSNVIKKYLPEKLDQSNYSYDDLWQISSNYDSKELEEVSSWMYNLSNKIPTPEWIEILAKVPWSSVYTSAIDTVFQKALNNEVRDTQPIFSQKQRISNPRNKRILHVNYLYGKVGEIDPESRPVLDQLQKVGRSATINTMLNLLKNIVTPKGILIFEGYNHKNDWISLESLFPYLKEYGREQIYFFSASEELEENIYFKELLKVGKVVPIKESLSSFLTEAFEAGLKDYYENLDDRLEGHWIRLKDGKLFETAKVPSELWKKINLFGTIVEESFFSKEENPEDHTQSFLNFIANSGRRILWSAYEKGLAFQREFEKRLFSKILSDIKSQHEYPIILSGQSSVGKTTALGHVAFSLSKDHGIPTIFIGREAALRVEEIDSYGQWIESVSKDPLVIVWDGMEDDTEIYYRVLKSLHSRGRKVLVVGSNYSHKIIHDLPQNYIHAEAKLSKEERTRFLSYLKKFSPETATFIGNLKSLQNENIIALLFNNFVVTRPQITEGISLETRFWSKWIIDNLKLDQEKRRENKKAFTFGDLFVEQGIITTEDIKKYLLSVGKDDDEEDIEETRNIDEIIYYIFIPGQFGILLPVELLIRLFNTSLLSSNIFSKLREAGIFDWQEDRNGNIYLGPRTALEANIALRHLGGIGAQIPYIKNLLYEIRDNHFLNDYNLQSSSDLEFGIKLLSNIGPNGPQERRFKDYWFEIAEVLMDLRENYGLETPRLILKEAFFLREACKLYFEGQIASLPPETTVDDIFQRIDDILKKSIYKLEETSKNKVLRTYLTVEREATYATKLIYLLDTKSSNIKELLNTYNNVLSLTSEARSIFIDNYYSIDTLGYATRDFFKADKEGTIKIPIENKIMIEAFVRNIFDSVLLDDIDFENQEQILKRKSQVLHAFGNYKLDEEVLNELLQKGSKEPYYVRASRMVQKVNFNEPKLSDKDLDQCFKAYKYLESNSDAISKDHKCINLWFKLWWTIKNRQPLFSGEKLTTKFSEGDWIKCYEFVQFLSSNPNSLSRLRFLYLKGISEFHLHHFSEFKNTFQTLDRESDFSVSGLNRVKKSYLVSSPDGKPRTFEGTVKYDAIREDGNIGQLYISDFNIYIPFQLSEFGYKEVEKFQRIEGFYIGFNYRGAVAVAKKYL